MIAAAVAALSGGHLLIEDVPGVGETVLARALAASLGAELSRVQGHPDLLPSDITGVSVFMPDTGSLGVPTGTGLRARRARGRAQPHPSPDAVGPPRDDGGAAGQRGRPVLAAARAAHGDRHTEPAFATRARSRSSRASSTGSPWRPRSATPTPRARCSLALHAGGTYALAELTAVCTPDEWLQCAARVPSRYWCSESVAEYTVEICRASRTAPGVFLGASPRAAISLIRVGAGTRRARRQGVRGARRREGGCGGVPVASGPHRRGRREHWAIVGGDPPDPRGHAVPEAMSRWARAGPPVGTHRSRPS